MTGRLPPERDAARRRSTGPRADTASTATAEPLAVLVVDDESTIRVLLRHLLDRDPRFTVTGEAVDGRQAADVVGELQPDVVLLDLVMPGLDGREALPEILRTSPCTMVLVLSSLSAIDEAEAAFASGAFAYVEKSAMGPGLADEIVALHERFRRALAGETVWARSDPLRIRR